MGGSPSADDGLEMPSVEELSGAAGYRDESLTELTEAAAESLREDAEEAHAAADANAESDERSEETSGRSLDAAAAGVLELAEDGVEASSEVCLLYTSPSPRDS